MSSIFNTILNKSIAATNTFFHRNFLLHSFNSLTPTHSSVKFRYRTPLQKA